MGGVDVGVSPLKSPGSGPEWRLSWSPHSLSRTRATRTSSPTLLREGWGWFSWLRQLARAGPDLLHSCHWGQLSSTALTRCGANSPECCSQQGARPALLCWYHYVVSKRQGQLSCAHVLRALPHPCHLGQALLCCPGEVQTYSPVQPARGGDSSLG